MLAEPLERVRRGPPLEVVTQELARRRTQLVALEPRAGVEAHQLRVRREPVDAKHAPEVLTRERVEARVVEVPQQLAVHVDRLRDDRRFHVLVAIARRGGVREVPRVDLDRHRPPVGELLGDLRRQRPVRLHLVDVDPEEPLEILRRRLEERPLVALEVHPHEKAHRRQRLVAARVQELDDDVGVAVRLGVGALACVDRVRPVRRRVEAEQARHSRSSERTPPGQAPMSSPCRRRSASTTRSSPKPRHAVWATPPPSSSIP